MALKRFLNMEQKREKDKELKEKYVTFVESYRERNFWEKVKDREGILKSQKEYYSLHHCVFKRSDPNGNIRVVFDATASFGQGILFNKCKEPCSVVQRSILEILIDFRGGKVAV
jgi:hypothetical protein